MSPYNVCESDFDKDGDVDSVDLAVFSADIAGDVGSIDLSVFAADFGKTECLHDIFQGGLNIHGNGETTVSGTSRDGN